VFLVVVLVRNEALSVHGFLSVGHVAIALHLGRDFLLVIQGILVFEHSVLVNLLCCVVEVAILLLQVLVLETFSSELSTLQL